jgi:hypothetical protein
MIRSLPVVVALVLCSSVGCRSSAFTKAKKLWDEGKLDEAISFCHKMSQSSTIPPDAAEFFAFLYTQKLSRSREGGTFHGAPPHLFTEAFRAARDAVDRSPTGDAHFYLGAVYLLTASYVDFGGEPDLEAIRKGFELGSSRHDFARGDRRLIAELLLSESQRHLLISRGLQPPGGGLRSVPPASEANREAARTNLQLIERRLQEGRENARNKPAPPSAASAPSPLKPTPAAWHFCGAGALTKRWRLSRNPFS